jgi:hypothetical protein
VEEVLRRVEEVLRIWRLEVGPYYFRMEAQSDVLGCANEEFKHLRLSNTFVHCNDFPFQIII